MQIKCLGNGLYSLKNSHISFGNAPPYGRIPFEHHCYNVGAFLTLMMTSMSSTINRLQQMRILPTLGTCSNCSSPTGAFKSEGLYNYFWCSNCKKKKSLLQNTFLSNSNTTLHDFVLLMYLFCNSHRTNNTVSKETFLPQQLKK